MHPRRVKRLSARQSGGATEKKKGIKKKKKRRCPARDEVRASDSSFRKTPAVSEGSERTLQSIMETQTNENKWAKCVCVCGGGNEWVCVCVPQRPLEGKLMVSICV